MSKTTNQNEQRDNTEDEIHGDTYYLDGDFTVVGHLMACRKCGRKILVEMALIGSQHHVGVTVVCGNCLEVTEEFRKEHPKIVSTIENWLHEGEKRVMHEKTKPDRKVYVENRAKFFPEDLLPYADQWIAWSADGSKIVAHHGDLAEVARQVETLGLTREEVVFDFIPPEGEVTTLL